jgi:hypothetical protein
MVCILYFSTALFENENEMNQLEKLLGMSTFRIMA